MEFLSYNEKKQLHYILINRTMLTTASARLRSSILKLCELEHLCAGIEFNTTTYEFVVNLYPKLSEAIVVKDNKERLGLIIFLEHLADNDPDLFDDEKAFFRHVISKWEQVHASAPQGPARRNQISSLLAQARQEQAPPPTTPKPIKIDRDVIVNYNLDEQMARFRQTVGYAGAFTFAVWGNFNILERYIIERIRRELKAKTERPHQRFEVRLYQQSIVTPADIERMLLDACSIERVTDLFDDQANTDIVLIFWNYDLPLTKMKDIAENFWITLKPSVLPSLQQQSRCLVVVWADVVNNTPLECFTPVSTPNKFELAELLPWFRGKLRQLNLEELLIEQYLDRLRNQRGHLVGTYQELNQIIRELQGGRLPL